MHHQDNNNSFWQLHRVTWQKSTITPPRAPDVRGNVLILELNDLEYLLLLLLWFLLVSKACGVGEELCKFLD